MHSLLLKSVFHQLQDVSEALDIRQQRRDVRIGEGSAVTEGFEPPADLGAYGQEREHTGRDG